MAQGTEICLQDLVGKVIEYFLVQGLKITAQGIRASVRRRLDKEWKEIAKRKVRLAGVMTSYLGLLTVWKIKIGIINE